MVVVDTSVWVDYFNGLVTPQTNRLNELLGTERLLVGDLILAEVLQGFRSDTSFRLARSLLEALEVREIGGREIAVASAQNYRALRARGITVRGTIDTIIATFCIAEGHLLLHSDRDFDPFEDHLGLRVLKA
jgi:predicted nucleic acid-binding protein